VPGDFCFRGKATIQLIRCDIHFLTQSSMDISFNMGVIASMKLSLISPTASIASRPSYRLHHLDFSSARLLHLTSLG